MIVSSHLPTPARIFVPQPIPPAAAARLETLGEVTTFPHLDRVITHEEVLAGVRGQHVLYALGGIRYDEEVLAAADDARLIASMHVNPGWVDVSAATRRGIPVSIIPEMGLVRTTAEFTFALLMATAWRLPEADQFLRDGLWQQNQSEVLLGSRLYGKTLGIVGLGGIGSTVAQMAGGFRMDVLYYKRSRLSHAEEFALSADYRSLEDLLRESDFVVLTPPLTAETKGMVTAELIGLMKPGAILVNTSRGQVLDEEALTLALEEGRLRGAGLDVYQNEVKPTPGPSDRLKALPHVVLTPHIGSAARETREEMAMRTVDNIERFLTVGRPIDVLNPEVYGEAARPNERIG